MDEKQFPSSPENCLRISKMIELNPTLPVELIEAAVGASDGEASFQLMPESSMGKLSDSSFQPSESGVREITIPLRSLDHFFSNRDSQPQMMKIDVEGAEADVLRGASELISKERPRLLIEIHSRSLAQECGGILRGWDYEVQVLETKRPPDGRTEPEVCHFIALPT
jgi:FkbM family methyltransferase